MYQVYKFTVIVLCASIISAKLDESLLTEDLKSLMATLHKTCVDQIGIDEARIDKLKEAVFEDDAKSKCYVKCVMPESGVMDENGDVDMGAFAEVIPEKLREKTKEAFVGCVSREGGKSDLCEKAFSILHCTHESNPENYFFV
nr:odorant binding protein 7 [Pagiophloeus tsushimanus]